MSRSRVAYAGLFAGVIALGFMGPLALGQDARSRAVDALFAQWDKPDTPGAVLLVAQEGRVVHEGTYGVRDVRTKKPNTPDTIFYAASTSKQFTAACVVHLAHKGRLSIDDKVRKHIPELPACTRDVTIRHLIHHRSGFRDFFELMMLAQWKMDEAIAPERILALICRQKALNFAPGSDFLYSNTGYFLLAELVRRVGEMSLRDYAREHIFKPLGMTRTSFRDHAKDTPADAAVGHRTSKGSYRARPTLFAVPGSGGLMTTAGDLLRWQMALTAGKWVDGKLTKQLATPPELSLDKRCSPTMCGYACGLINQRHRGLPVVFHPGGSFGYRANLVCFPEQQLVIAILANASDVDAPGLAWRIAAIYLEEALAKAMAGDKREAATKRLSPGFSLYRDRETGDFLIRSTRRDGTSRLATLSWKVQVEALSEMVLRGVDTPLFATLVSGGKELRLEVAGQSPITFDRVTVKRVPPARLAEVAGDYTSAELDASIALAVRGGKLRLDDRALALSAPPFMAVDVNTFINDRGMRIDLLRDAAGNVTGLSFSTGRARRITFLRAARK